jgi:hypothetical protein
MNKEDPRRVRIPQGRKVMDAVAGEEQIMFVLVATQKFAQPQPRIMIEETIPAGICGLSVVLYGQTPLEFDIRF